VRRAGKPLAGKRISIRGLGLKRSVKTGRGGRVRFYVRVARHGRLRLAASGQPARCARKLTVTKPRTVTPLVRHAR
jgi:uncharacterized metal-binding protein